MESMPERCKDNLDLSEHTFNASLLLLMTTVYDFVQEVSSFSKAVKCILSGSSTP